MRLYRYMSMKEFQKLSSWCDIVNSKNFTKCRTESNGFCFLTEDSNGYNPIYALEFLTGIVTDDVLVEFDVDSELVQESSGLYANPHSFDCDFIEITEYCTRSYSCNTFKPLRYCLPDLHNLKDTVWYIFN